MLFYIGVKVVLPNEGKNMSW